MREAPKTKGKLNFVIIPKKDQKQIKGGQANDGIIVDTGQA